MTRESLVRAGEHAAAAADGTDDAETADRLADVADQLANLAARERGPDHGRLARLENALREVAGDDEASTEIEAALADIQTYRETLEGV